MFLNVINWIKSSNASIFTKNNFILWHSYNLNKNSRVNLEHNLLEELLSGSVVECLPKQTLGGCGFKSSWVIKIIWNSSVLQAGIRGLNRPKCKEQISHTHAWPLTGFYFDKNRKAWADPHLNPTPVFHNSLHEVPLLCWNMYRAQTKSFGIISNTFTWGGGASPHSHFRILMPSSQQKPDQVREEATPRDQTEECDAVKNHLADDSAHQ